MHLQQLRTWFINADQLNAGVFDEVVMTKFWSQISSNAGLKDVKKRLVDHLRSSGVNCTMDEVRLWMHTEDYMKPDSGDIKEACKNIAKGTTPQP